MLDTRIRKVAAALYEHLDTPRSLKAYLLLKYREWDQLVAMTIDPLQYLEGPSGSESYRRDVQAADFLRKSPLVPTTVDLQGAAMDAFWESEEQCLRTNQYLSLIRYPSTNESPCDGALRKILHRARKIASRILGPVPNSLDGGFGPGTSFELKGSTFTTLADKMWITPHATRSCMPLFEWMHWPTLWGRTRADLVLPLPSIARGNRFTTVPKDSTKHRGICVEPLGNLYVQLGIGRYLKGRLAAVGIKVNRSTVDPCPIKRLRAVAPSDGQTIHRRLARDGSVGKGWATIDLSNASDTVAFELVRDVIPPDWFELLCAARSPLTLIEGEWVHLDKFSSMGNGFTFELETLIFAAILSAGCEVQTGRSLFVYGDDIVIPEEKSREALAILRACGFSPNERKSFCSGPFRESCGGDFFSGFPVRPYQSKGKLESPLEFMAMHNELKKKWPRATLALARCVDAVPLKLRCFGPAYLGDCVFHGAIKRSWYQDGIRWVATLVSMPLTIPLRRWGDEFTLALALSGVSSKGLTPRDEVEGYRISRASVS